MLHCIWFIDQNLDIGKYCYWFLWLETKLSINVERKRRSIQQKVSGHLNRTNLIYYVANRLRQEQDQKWIFLIKIFITAERNLKQFFQYVYRLQGLCRMYTCSHAANHDFSETDRWWGNVRPDEVKNYVWVRRIYFLAIRSALIGRTQLKCRLILPHLS